MGVTIFQFFKKHVVGLCWPTGDRDNFWIFVRGVQAFPGVTASSWSIAGGADNMAGLGSRLPFPALPLMAVISIAYAGASRAQRGAGRTPTSPCRRRSQ